MHALRRPAVVLYAVAAALVLAPAAARAQFQPRPLGDPAVGETFHIEAFAGFWNPTADMSIAAEGLGQAPTTIDLKNDLGLTDHKIGDFQIVLRPAPKHKLRLQFVPISYTQSGTLTRDVVFNGQRFTINLPVQSTLDWKAYRFGYEYDFIRRDRGFGGLIIETKYTDVKATLSNDLTTEYARAQAPVPAIGGIARVYPVPNVGVTFELTAFPLPRSVSDTYKLHYVDIDAYGTINFSRYVGAQLGYRSIDLNYLAKEDSGTLKLKGIYLGLVARY
jgi:hypothetical protein